MITASAYAAPVLRGVFYLGRGVERVSKDLRCTSGSPMGRSRRRD